MMTPQQRSEAARKAAASRRANRAAGVRPAPRGRKGGPVFSTPRPVLRDLQLVALAAIEDALAVKQAQGITDDARLAFLQLQKIKGLAFGQTNSPEAQNEADAALRTALLHAIKLAF